MSNKNRHQQQNQQQKTPPPAEAPGGENAASIKTEETLPPRKLLTGKVQHCGMPIPVLNEEARVFCMGCHAWHDTDKLLEWDGK